MKESKNEREVKRIKENEREDERIKERRKNGKRNENKEKGWYNYCLARSGWMKSKEKQRHNRKLRYLHGNVGGYNSKKSLYRGKNQKIMNQVIIDLSKCRILRIIAQNLYHVIKYRGACLNWSMSMPYQNTA